MKKSNNPLMDILEKQINLSELKKQLSPEQIKAVDDMLNNLNEKVQFVLNTVKENAPKK